MYHKLKYFAVNVILAILISFISVSTVFAIQVSGILSDAIWSVSDSPVRVMGDIEIPSGVKLEIEPGVRVLFTGAYVFEIHGVLSAIGTRQDSIVFTSLTPDSAETKWRGLRFFDTDASDADSRLSFCRIEHSWARGEWPENCGGGIYINGSSPDIDRCEILYNLADGDGGGIYTVFTKSMISNNLIVGNFAKNFGGGLFIANSAPSIINCTVALDTASKWGGGAFVAADGEPIIANSIFAGNYQILEGNIPNGDDFFPNLARVRSAEPEVSYSCIQHISSEYPGRGNISRDPNFINNITPPYDFRLAYSSPCVDAGDPQMNPGSEPDILVNRLNMGCYGGIEDATLSVPVIYIEEYDLGQSINYGSIRINAQVSREIIIENHGHYRMFLNEFRFTSDDMFPDSLEVDDVLVPSYTVNPIEPGESGKFLLSFRPSRIQAYNDTVYFISTDTISQVPFLNLSGAGIDPIANLKDSLSFGARALGAVHQIDLYISNTGESDLVVDEDIDVQGNVFDAEIVDQDGDNDDETISPGDSVIVRVLFEPARPEGFAGTISVQNNDVTQIVTVDGIGIGPKMEIDADELFLGYVYFDGDTATYYVDIVNEGGGSWLLFDIDLISPFILALSLKESSDPLSEYLNGRLSEETIELLNAFDGGGNVSDDLVDHIIADLNLVILDELIFAPQRFSHIQISDRLTALLEDPLEEDIPQLNRLLLEEGYPIEIAKRELHITNASLTTNDFSVVLPDAGVMVAQNDTFKLPVRFHPPRADETFEDVLTINSNYPESHTVDISGRGMPQPGRYMFGEVSGLWDWSDGDPAYVIQDSVTVPQLELLKIEPGAIILFDPEAKMVAKGELRAIGTVDDSISFLPRDQSGTDDARWQGLSLQFEDASKLSYCVINGSLDGLSIIESGPVVQFCTISDNGTSELDGGGIDMENSGAIIRSSIIESNVARNGGGIYVLNSKPVISNCQIRNNTADVGGGCFLRFQAGASMVSNLIYGNTGGGITVVDQSSPRIVNNTIANNTGYGISAIIRSIPVLVNTIVWGNTDGSLGIDVNSNSLVSYCDIEGGSSGNQNIDVPPRFEDTSQGNYQLSDASPLIDKGNPEKQYRDFYFPPSKGTAINDIGAFGGPQGGLWDQAEVSISVFQNAGFPQWLDIYTATMETFSSSPVCSIEFENGDRSIVALTRNQANSSIFLGSFEIPESGSIFITVNAEINGNSVKVGRTFNVTMLEPNEEGSISLVGINGRVSIKPENYNKAVTLLSGIDSEPLKPIDGVTFISPVLFVKGLSAELIGDAEIRISSDELGWSEDELKNLKFFGLYNDIWKPLESAYSSGEIKAKINETDYFALAYSEGFPEYDEKVLPENLGILSAYPNPFNQKVTLEFDLKESTFIELAIYDLAGREVSQLVSSNLNAGKHVATWEATLPNGSLLPSGIYWARLESENEIRSVKLLLLR